MLTFQSSLSNRTINLNQISASDFITIMHNWQFISKEESNNNEPSNESDEYKPLPTGNN